MVASKGVRRGSTHHIEHVRTSKLFILTQFCFITFVCLCVGGGGWDLMTDGRMIDE
jgi:hypothetical protein